MIFILPAVIIDRIILRQRQSVQPQKQESLIVSGIFRGVSHFQQFFPVGGQAVLHIPAQRVLQKGPCRLLMFASGRDGIGGVGRKRTAASLSFGGGKTDQRHLSAIHGLIHLEVLICIDIIELVEQHLIFYNPVRRPDIVMIRLLGVRSGKLKKTSEVFGVKAAFCLLRIQKSGFSQPHTGAQHLLAVCN